MDAYEKWSEFDFALQIVKHVMKLEERNINHEFFRTEEWRTLETPFYYILEFPEEYSEVRIVEKSAYFSFRPSYNLNHAFKIIYSLANDDYEFEMENFVPSSDSIVWNAAFAKGGNVTSSDWRLSPALAICIAALRIYAHD